MVICCRCDGGNGTPKRGAPWLVASAPEPGTEPAFLEGYWCDTCWSVACDLWGHFEKIAGKEAPL